MKYTTPAPTVDITKYVPELARHGKEIVRLHPHRVERDLLNDVSKAGGLFLWPSAEPWPMWEDDKFKFPFVPVLQLRKADVPEMPFPAGMDLFQLLWTPRRDEDLIDGPTKYLPVPKVFWRNSAEIANPLTRFPTLKEYGVDERDFDISDNVPRMCGLCAERVMEYPDPDQLRWGLGEEGKLIWDKIGKSDFAVPVDFAQEFKTPQTSKDLRESYYSICLSRCPGLKVAGGESYTEMNRTWESLLAIPSWEYDHVSAFRWRAIEDRKAGKDLKELKHPMGLDLGRTQIVHVWVCRDGLGWEIDMSIVE
jgi:hypothetical protein